MVKRGDVVKVGRDWKKEEKEEWGKVGKVRRLQKTEGEVSEQRED